MDSFVSEVLLPTLELFLTKLFEWLGTRLEAALATG